MTRVSLGLLLIIGVGIWTLVREPLPVASEMTKDESSSNVPINGNNAMTEGIGSDPGIAPDEVEQDAVIDDCPNSVESAVSDAAIAAVIRELVQSAEVLAESNNAEHLLAAFLLYEASERKDASELIHRAYDLSPLDPLVNWNRLLFCLQNPMRCDLQKVRDQVLIADAGNGAIWVDKANSEINAGNEEGALDAMRRAISASRYDEYFLEQILLLERSFSATTDWPYAQRVFRATGFAAAMWLPIGSVVEKCRQPAENKAAWMNLCDQLGNKMFRDGQTVMARSIGLALRKNAAQNGTDDRRKKEIAQMKQKFGSSFYRFGSNRAAQDLLANDTRVLQDYLHNFRAHGELAAQQMLEKEADRLQGLPDYDQCNFSGNPYGF